jgi:DNA polymerase-3 subunit alpha
VDEFTGGYKVTADRLLDLESLRAQYAHMLVVELAGERLKKGALADLERLLRGHLGGKCMLRFRYRNDAAHVWLAAGGEWTVKPDAALISELTRILGEQHVSFLYKPIEPPAKTRYRKGSWGGARSEE